MSPTRLESPTKNKPGADSQAAAGPRPTSPLSARSRSPSGLDAKKHEPPTSATLLTSLHLLLQWPWNLPQVRRGLLEPWASNQDSAVRTVPWLSLWRSLAVLREGQPSPRVGVPDHAPLKRPGSWLLRWAPEDKLRHRTNCDFSHGGARLRAEPRRAGGSCHPMWP